jgi:hypothetical protein
MAKAIPANAPTAEYSPGYSQRPPRINRESTRRPHTGCSSPKSFTEATSAMAWVAVSLAAVSPANGSYVAKRQCLEHRIIERRPVQSTAGTTAGSTAIVPGWIH